MHSFYSGDIEKDKIEKVEIIKEKEDKKPEDINLKTAPTSDYNHKISKHLTSQVDIEKAQLDAKKILSEGDVDKVLESKLMFERQSVSLFRIYCHLFEPIDWILFFLGIIGSNGAGAGMPLMSYLISDVYSDVGNTSENRDTTINYEMMISIVKKSMNSQIKRQLIYGSIIFVCNFLSAFCWSLLGNRCIFNLRKNYFTVILRQEQGWFDKNNAFQFATKVQAQIGQVAGGIGGIIGSILTTLAQCIMGFTFAFMASWKLTLVLLTVSPFILFSTTFLISTLKKGIIMARKIWETAGGIAEEILYNIKTVASFANFEYELQRFYEKVEIVWQIDLINSCKLGFSLGFIIFFLNLTIFMEEL